MASINPGKRSRGLLACCRYARLRWVGRTAKDKAKIVADPIRIEVRVGSRICQYIVLGLRVWPKYQTRLVEVSGTRDDVTIQMKPQPQPTTQEVLAGPVDGLTCHNEASGFCVPGIKAL